MRSEKELEALAERVYWHVERGEMSEAARLLQSCQKEGLKFGLDRCRPEYGDFFRKEMAALRC